MTAPSELVRLQWQFASATRLLFDRITSQGFHWTYGEAWRSEWEATRLAKTGLGIVRSLHCDRLAIDINLFAPSGIWLNKTEDHEQFGAWWEELGVKSNLQLAWGGRFKRPDGNHYSLSYQGRR